MVEICDYSIIINKRRPITSEEPGVPIFNFDTGGRSEREAVLFITTHGPVNIGIEVNGSRIGSLAKDPNATGSSTQVFSLPKDLLNSGNNELRFDVMAFRFIIEFAICFFKQRVASP